MNAISAMSRSQAREHRKTKLIDSVKKLNNEKGVHGVLVTSNAWEVLQSTFDGALTEYWVKHLRNVEDLGIALIRDSDPSDDLRFLRLQTSKYEILISISHDHRLLVVYSTKRNPFRNSAYVLRHLKHEEETEDESRAPSAMDPCSLRLKFAKKICRKKCETQAGVFTQIKKQKHGRKSDTKKKAKKPKHNTEIMGGKDEVVIVEKVAGKEVPQSNFNTKKH